VLGRPQALLQYVALQQCAERCGVGRTANSILDMEAVVISNNRLEEFLERLLRWDELCRELKELYYKYLDLAAFRSEKCYFPGRRCRRSWKRQYDMGDLTLMWTYILNTAPLCGKLMRALAEVEFRIRLRALENLERFGSVENKTKPDGKHELIQIYLKQPVQAYLVFLDKLYIIWGDFNGIPKKGWQRAVEIERRVVNAIERYKRGEKVDVQVDEFEIDDEYRRLWLEVPLPEGTSKLLGGKAKVPVALFRNLGWLLSDDNRYILVHSSSNLGQVAMKIFDWIAMAMYAKKGSANRPLIFRLAVYQFTRTKNGVNPLILVQPIGTAAKIIRTAYEQFGIVLGKPQMVFAHGYAVLKALREVAFGREGNTHVVNDVGAWIAFSAATATLILGDGIIMPFTFAIAIKTPLKATFNGKVNGIKELSKALGSVSAGRETRFQIWHMRALLPIPPMPIFEKTKKLYATLVNFPVVATVKIGDTTYLLSYEGSGRFKIGKEKAAKLYEVAKQFGLRVKMKKEVLVLGYTQLRELAKHVPVQFLNDLEKEFVKEIKPIRARDLDLEAVKRVLDEVAKMARITVGLLRGRPRVRIYPYDKSKLLEIAAMLEAAGIRFSINRRKGHIYIDERRSVEAIRQIMPHLFSKIYFRVDVSHLAFMRA